MKLSIIQVPYDSGQFDRRMGSGPLHLINQGLVDWLLAEGNDVRLTEVRLPEEFMPEVAASIYIQRQIKDTVEANRRAGYLPLVLAGNCNYAAFGAVAALQQQNTGILWFDAHGDFNTPETSTSGFFDGMSLSLITGNSWRALRKSLAGFEPVPEDQVLLIGARDLDVDETLLLKKSNIVRINIEDLRTKSLETVLNAFFKPLVKRVEHIYLHIDLDVLDVSDFVANHYAAPDGCKLTELLQIISIAKEIFEIAAVALTAYDPGCDRHQRADDVVQSVLKSLTQA